MLKHGSHWYQKHSFGSPWDKNIDKLYFGYTHTYKKVAAASNTAVMAATATAATAQTITDGLTNPDVPRNLVVKPAGTTTSVGDGIVRIYGTNVEGASIVEEFQLVDDSATAITGNMAFKTVTRVVLPICDGTAATISVGTGVKLGLNHRLYPSNTTVKVVKEVAGVRTIDGTATVASDESEIEDNTVSPSTAPDAATIYTIYYSYDRWSVGDVNDMEKETTTSTSTSTSSTSSSTSSTSTSTTSISTSTTSISTSSTSTSTTTVP